jgi:hypothetical protein
LKAFFIFSTNSLSFTKIIGRGVHAGVLPEFQSCQNKIHVGLGNYFFFVFLYKKPARVIEALTPG